MTVRQQLEQKYGTGLLGGLITPEEAELLFMTEQPELYALEGMKRNLLARAAQPMTAAEEKGIETKLDKVYKAIAVINAADLAAFYSRD